MTPTNNLYNAIVRCVVEDEAGRVKKKALRFLIDAPKVQEVPPIVTKMMNEESEIVAWELSSVTKSNVSAVYIEGSEK